MTTRLNVPFAAAVALARVHRPGIVADQRAVRARSGP